MSKNKYLLLIKEKVETKAFKLDNKLYLYNEYYLIVCKSPILILTVLYGLVVEITKFYIIIPIGFWTSFFLMIPFATYGSILYEVFIQIESVLPGFGAWL